MWIPWSQADNRPAQEQSDEDLIHGVAAGDESAFLIIYRRRQSAIFRYAVHLSGDHDIAADVVQETFLCLLRQSQRLDASRGTVLAWLFAVARNQVMKQMTARRRHLSLEESVSEEPAADVDLLEELARGQIAGKVREAVPKLPAVYREVLILCDLQGLAYETVAGIIDCPVGTVRSRLHRARSLLANKIRPLVGYTS
jgi:RNA polymerase sigma-70 factor (ECF subfamily)